MKEKASSRCCPGNAPTRGGGGEAPTSHSRTAAAPRMHSHTHPTQHLVPHTLVSHTHTHTHAYTHPTQPCPTHTCPTHSRTRTHACPGQPTWSIVLATFSRLFDLRAESRFLTMPAAGQRGEERKERRGSSRRPGSSTGQQQGCREAARQRVDDGGGWRAWAPPADAAEAPGPEASRVQPSSALCCAAAREGSEQARPAAHPCSC